MRSLSSIEWNEMKKIASRTLHPEGWLGVCASPRRAKAYRRTVCQQAEAAGLQALIVTQDDGYVGVWVRLPR
jgi:hypothetical protein